MKTVRRRCRRKKFDCAARLGLLLDFAERNALKGLSNAHNLLEFKIYLKMMVRELIVLAHFFLLLLSYNFSALALVT